MDDNKISHVDSKVVDWVIDKNRRKIWEDDSDTRKETCFCRHGHQIHQRQVHTDNDARVYKGKYRGVSRKKIEGTTTTPAKNDLFEIDENAEQLSEKKAEIFYHIAVKLLYVSKRARVDIQLAVAFLCTRVSCSTNQDWEKLGRLLIYLNRTLEMVRKIGMNNICMLQTWVDALYITHHDMKSHTGGIISL